MSESKKYFYLKLKDNFFDRPEIKMIEGMQNGYEYICVMQKMYLRSLCRDGKLLLTDTVPYDISMLSAVLGHNEAVIKTSIEIFGKLGLCMILEDKTIYMTEIQNFIGKSSSEADRIKEYRSKISGHVQNSYKCTPELELKQELELNTEINIDIEKTAAPKRARTQFVKPTIDEIILYFSEIGIDSDTQAHRFFDYYESKGWLVGKQKMKDWKSSARNWKRNYEEYSTKKQKPAPVEYDIDSRMQELKDMGF